MSVNFEFNRHCLLKRSYGAGFAASSWSDKHEAMTNLDCIVELKAFVNKGLNWLEICNRTLLL